MSENSEHLPDDTEVKTKAMEDLPNDSSTSEAKLMIYRTSSTALLENEEMPTYISVSSLSRRDDDSDIINAKQQENASIEEDHSDDQAASSVYVLSSEEESDQPPYDEEDDEDEYGDSDEMENLELDNEMDPQNRNNMKYLMDEDDDDEDDEDDEESFRRMHNDDDDDDNDEFDEICDSASADFVLNKGLKKRDKKKSSSLQDFSAYKNNMYTGYNKRRYSSNFKKQNNFNIPQNAVIYSGRRKQQIPSKYQHVQSKVKLYIKDIKEQNRRSMEKHMKDHIDVIHDKNNTNYKNNEIEEVKPAVTKRTIKNYAEKTIKELEIAETCNKDSIIYNASPLILNGQDNRNALELAQEENIPTQIEIETNASVQDDKKDAVNSDNNKIEQKQNGTIELTFSERDPQQFSNIVQPSFIQNDHQEIPAVLFNLRSVSYEEYMQNSSGASQKANLDQNAHVIEQEHPQTETCNVEPMDICEMDNNSTTYSLRIENIKSINTITDEVKGNNEKITFDKENEKFNKTTSDNLEIVTLKNQLEEKTVQYNVLHETYQKQVAENLKMKQEMEELRKSLTKYEKENKPPERKVASIQTDFITDPATNKDHNQTDTTLIKQSNNKVSGSSVVSTLSSIEQWTDSACNLSLSMKPPEVIKTLHSDDSIVLTNTPKKNPRSLSRAFITSSRILQTLSNITQGKTKSESPLVQNSKKRLNENTSMESQNDDDNCQSRPSSSKKRKIADIFGPSNFLQPFKTSPISGESSMQNQLKSNKMSNAESQSKCESVSKKLASQDSFNIDTSQLGNTSMENKGENIDDPEDNVKCFVFNENENSKDRSFLILAEEPTKEKATNDENRVRECGPFLLGNIEVRMSEINGTINIWGKEINDESIFENESEMETSTKVKNDKKYYCLQKSPNTRFNGSNIICSSGKKSRNPVKLELSSVESNISCPHSISFNAPKSSCSVDKSHLDNLCNQRACVAPCENCDSSKHRKEWSRYKRMHSQEKLHSYCTDNLDIGQKCNCFLRKEKQRSENTCNCNRNLLSAKEYQPSASGNIEPNKHLRENIANSATEDNEFVCGYHTHVCRHALHDPGENYPKSHKCCGASREASICEQLTNTDRECNESCNHRSSNMDEEEPLIALKQLNETPETRRRRLSGKRVREILMDLLRGCGDCYSPSASSNNKVCSHKKEASCSTNCSPQIKISPCASSEASCSNQGQPGRCCHAYAQRIESQLEEFRVEMEKVRSRSDAILDMLNMFHSADIN